MVRPLNILVTLVFWALRGGGAGSWGVIISATVRTYPIFNATSHTVDIIASTNESTADLLTLHAKHIFDWDDVHGGQFFQIINGNLETSIGGNLLSLQTTFPNITSDGAKALMKPFLDEVRSMNFSVRAEETNEGFANDLSSADNESPGASGVAGSRLIPADAYKKNPDIIGRGIVKLIEEGVPASVDDYVQH